MRKKRKSKKIQKIFLKWLFREIFGNFKDMCQNPHFPIITYILMNTDFRKKAISDFEKNFYKLMNNSVFGKTMENLRNRVDIKIVSSNETDKIRKLIASPLCSRHILFSNDLAGVDMRKTKLVLNKPVYTGMTILDNSKILMYDFFYNHRKVRAAVHRQGQPSPGDRNGRRLQRHGSEQASL